MKTLTVLFTLFYFLNALAVAPYGIKGQQQTQTLYSNVHQFPNNQVTNLGGINALVETGNTNILDNPSFEGASLGAWVNAVGVLNKETSVVIAGKSSARVALSAQTLSFTQSSVLYQAQFSDGVQGLAMVRVKSDVALKVCSIQAGTVSTTNCVDVLAANKWGLYKVPFILGATSNGISIASSGNVSGVVFIDDTFVGAIDLKVDIDQSRIAGESYFAGTASCAPSTTATTISPLSASAACPGPTIVSSNLGAWATTDSDLLRQTITNLPAGRYKATFLFGNFTSSGANTLFAINDGTTTCEPTFGAPFATGTIGQIVTCIFNYTSSGNRVFELYAANQSAQTLTVQNGVSSPRVSTKFILEYFGSGSVYTSNNADTDWASCGLTGAAFTGFGSAVPTPSLQCKRQGSDLLMKGTFTAGTTPTAVEARLALPVWNGVQLVSAGSSIVPSLQLSGDAIYSSSSSTIFRHAVLIEPSVQYATFGVQLSANAAFQKATGITLTASSQLFSINARIPIEGWDQSNIIIGSFNGLQSCTSTLACTDTFSATISGSGVVSGENVDWINGNCTYGTYYSCTYLTTLKGGGAALVSPMNCTITTDNSGTSVTARTMTNSSTGISFQGLNSSFALAATNTSIICQKQGADYLGRTAMAVASDQNVRSIGSTNVDIQSVYFGSGANCATACSTGTCTICRQVGNKITSITFVSTGTYEANGIDGLNKYSCSGNGFIGGNYGVINHDLANSTTAKARLNTGAGASTANAAYAQLTCIGIP